MFGVARRVCGGRVKGQWRRSLSGAVSCLSDVHPDFKTLAELGPASAAMFADRKLFG